MRNAVLIALVLALSTAVVCADKVKVRVYMEAECPFCINYLTSTMGDVFNCHGIDSIADIGLIPYGNAKTDSDGNIECQHGDGECTSNVLMTCAIHLHDFKFAEYFPFVHCLESNDGHPGAARECAEQSKLSWSAIRKCAKSSQGHDWELEMGRKTEEADNDYTPWVVVNDEVVRSQAHSDNLLGYICQLSDAANKPACCSDAMAQQETTSVSTDLAAKVCWKSPERKGYYLRDHKDLFGQQLHDPVDEKNEEEDEEDDVQEGNDEDSHEVNMDELDHMFNDVEEEIDQN